MSKLPVAASGRSAIEVARQCAQDAGAIALERFRRPQEVSIKGRGNLLSQTDLEIEAFLTRALLNEFPDHRVLSEETAQHTSTDGWVWVVDPIDGTRNFVSGIPVFCINIALCHDGEPTVAVTRDPNHDEDFWARRGGGCRINDAPAHASLAPTIGDSVLGIDLGYDERRGASMLEIGHALFPNVQSVRIPGSAALGLAYAACGRYDVFVHQFLYPWDIAAGILLLRESGGTITTIKGGSIGIESRTVIAGSASAHADFLGWLRRHAQELDLPED